MQTSFNTATTLPVNIAEQSETNLYRTMTMLTTMWEEIATHFYKINSNVPIGWGTDTRGSTIFSFSLRQHPQEEKKLAVFFEDINQLEPPIQHHTNINTGLIAFPNIESAISFLSYLSTKMNWGLNMPLQEYVAEIVQNSPIARKRARNLTDFSDVSVLHLRQDVYIGIDQARGEFAAAYVTQQYGQLINMTYTLDEIERSLNAHIVDQAKGSKSRGAHLRSNEVLRFH